MPRLPAFPTDCTIRFDGAAIPARSGESVASALLAAGRPLLSRSAKYHRPRGAFCLAGSCGSCLVRADGLPNQRACRTACREGLEVSSQNAVPSAAHDLLGVIDAFTPHGLDHHHLATWSGLANRAAVAFSRRLAGLGRLADAAPAVPSSTAAEERLDALVVGAGPAGLGAAERLAAARLRVLVADAEPLAGGRLRAHLGRAGDPEPGWAEATAAAVRAAGGEVLLGAPVLGLWIDRGAPLAAIREGGPSARLRLLRPARIVLCPGGHPQPPEVEDGDRPGVYAGRGLAAALAEHGVLPGRRVAVLGHGPEADAVAERLRAAGAEAILAPGAVRVLGRARSRAILLAGGARLACDAVAVCGPPAPATDLARHLGAEVAFDAASGAFAVRVDARGATGVPGLWAAGEATGAMDAGAAREAGRRAGEEAARG
jgi:sarcosine oxidase subunit alpha